MKFEIVSRNLVSESPEINSLLVDALAALSERKTLLNYTMDEFCMVRKGVVSRGFIDALTRGSSASGPTNTSVKPIEMHAHDPVRYIGDMLAWIHQVFNETSSMVLFLDFEKKILLKHSMPTVDCFILVNFQVFQIKNVVPLCISHLNLRLCC